VRFALLAFAASLVALAEIAHAEVETVIVTASALPGTDVDPDLIPANVQTLNSTDLTRLGAASAIRTLSDSAAGVSLSEAQDNPFQPNLFYRGFEGSPLAGDAQGLAVYANGVRLNQPFGDVVNWDLLPDIAIDQMTIEGSSPVFGLNALGGSISVTMKNGFRWQGAEAEAFAGSYDHAQSSLQYGENDGTRSVYVAGTALSDSGWRDHSPSHVAQGFADFGWRGKGAEFHLDLIGAGTALTGNGPAPVELLAVDRSAVFTFPDKSSNRYGLANLYGTVQLAPTLSMQGNVYVSRSQQRTKNGDASDAEPCGDDKELLCLEDDTVLTDVSGNLIPNFLSSGTYGQLNQTSTSTAGFGGSLQVNDRARMFGFDNQLIAGIAYDGGRTDFSAQSKLGALTLARGFEGHGIVIDTANGGIAPVQVASANDYYGIYAADILNLTPALSMNLSARFNAANISLQDRLGTALNGSHSFTHLNPAAGFTYKLSQAATLYAGFAEANRAPTPAEFSCASPSAPCSLTNFFVGDPDLKQVVAQTYEAGARGELHQGDAVLHWHAGFYRVASDDDIMFVSSPVLGRAFFRNIGGTRRQGAELSADIAEGPWLASLNYAYTDATFQSFLTLSSEDNPRADGGGNIHVSPGDTLPSIPRHTVKATATYQPGEEWNVSLSGRYSSGQYLRGDESNLNPQTRPYFILSAAGSYRIERNLELFGEVENLLDARYETFGAFSPVDQVPIVQVPNTHNPRSLSPGAPLSVYAGVRVWL
jgi:outer membrane receptor protein involved in Fe transport